MIADPPAGPHRDELDSLRAQVAALRAQNEALRRPDRHGRWNGRAVAATAVMVVAALLLPAAVVAYWGQRTLLDTEQFVSTVAPLSQDPSIRTAVGEVISDQLSARIDLEQRVQDLLPDSAGPLAGPIASGVRSFIDQQIQNFLASDAFSRLWVQVNTRAQQGLVAALEGEPSAAIGIRGSQVVLDTGVIAEQVKQQLVQRGLGVLANVPVPPQAQRQIVLLDAPQLAEIRAAYVVAQPVAQWLVYVVAALFVVAVLLSRRRARAVLTVGAIAIGAAVLLRIALLVGESSFQTHLVGTPFELSARVFYTTLVSYLMLAIRTMFVAGLVLGAVGWLAGESRTAFTVRQRLAAGLSGAGSRTAAGRFGAVGQWVAARRPLLRVLVVVAGALVVVAQERITGAALLWALAAVLVAFAALEFVGGSAAPAPQPDPPAPADASSPLP